MRLFQEQDLEHVARCVPKKNLEASKYFLNLEVLKTNSLLTVLPHLMTTELRIRVRHAPFSHLLWWEKHKFLSRSLTISLSPKKTHRTLNIIIATLKKSLPMFALLIIVLSRSFMPLWWSNHQKIIMCYERVYWRLWSNTAAAYCRCIYWWVKLLIISSRSSSFLIVIIK